MTNFCLVYLAVSDLLASIVAIPLIVICNTTADLDCTAMDFATRFIAISTILHLMVVSTERFIMIVYPMYYIKLVTKKRIIVVLGSVWVFSLTVVLIQLSWVINETQAVKYDLSYSLTTFCGIVLPALCFMIFIYSKIFTVLRIQIKKIKRHNIPESLQANKVSEDVASKRSEHRAVLVFALMIITFVLGWFPYFIFTVLYDLGIEVPAAEFWLFLRFATSLMNPLLYTFLKTDFKKALIGRIRSESQRFYKSVNTQNETRI
ncbi:histamine H2 receptor-like isoform X1 [Actinia tenebrosa]|uniref:Histamine H2 receptor-like isoform X1 n=1 Tax=Actinia tenebrosa TaxID=6105 RepID=A0A6P8I5W2_ACTTE|nr:histamine H2 receptor-like isoform X1 [Actinia tenebrosa]XP_031560378.1 histamine H2 receptor-like isoform X1 [Actinia tenebrosa]